MGVPLVLLFSIPEEQAAVPEFNDLTHVLVYYKSPGDILAGEAPLGAILIAKSRTKIQEVIHSGPSNPPLSPFFWGVFYVQIT